MSPARCLRRHNTYKQPANAVTLSQERENVMLTTNQISALMGLGADFAQDDLQAYGYAFLAQRMPIPNLANTGRIIAACDAIGVPYYSARKQVWDAVVCGYDTHALGDALKVS